MVRMLGRISKDVPISLHGASLLHAACRYGRLELVTLLIARIPEIMFSITNEAYNPLHIAIVHQHIDIVKLLIKTQTGKSSGSHQPGSESTPEKEVSPCNVSQVRLGDSTHSGHTALHFAVALNNNELLHVLLKHRRMLKLNIEASGCGYTPLHLAVYLNHSQSARLLLKSGANPNASTTPVAVELSNISSSVLSEAVINKNRDLLQMLIEFGAEDESHDAIKLCIPSAEHRSFIVPLLGSLVKVDNSHKVSKQQARKDKVVKVGIAKWGNVQLTEVDPLWISQSIQNCQFFRSQSVEPQVVSQYITTVDLSGNRLTWLPRELFQLPGLQILNVSSNQIASLPDIQQSYNSQKDSYEWLCGGLARLNLSRNSLSEVPRFLFKIPSLRYLDLSHNLLCSLPFDLWSASKLYQVNASHNKLEELPSNWPGVLNNFPVVEPEMTDSESVSPSKTKKSHGRARPKLVSRNSLPAGMMMARGDSEEMLVTKLQEHLNISNSNLPIDWSAEDSKEEEYEGLAILNFSNNFLREVPDNFPCLCPKLIRLDLSYNRINSLSFPRHFPAGLKDLDLSHNFIDVLNCKECSSKPLPCTNPQVLAEKTEIFYDKVSFCSHRQHTQLCRLGALEMSHCGLHDVNFYTQDPPAPKKLTWPVTDNSVLGKLAPNGLQKLDGLVCPLLTRLVLSNNSLTQVPESICDMSSLNTLDLSYNRIIELPSRLGNLHNLWDFPLDGLNLISPPHNIIERGKTRDIIGFLWSLQQK